MSCGLAIAALLMLSDPNVALAAAQPSVAPSAPISVADEPMFADIVARSSALRVVVDAMAASDAVSDTGFAARTDYLALKGQATQLAAANLQGHLVLKARGTDNDLKCILRGISEDIPARLSALEAATTTDARTAALSDLSFLLRDNVEVITAPPAPEV